MTDPGPDPGVDALSIAMVCYPALGGSGVVASELARGLVARGHRVHVIATKLPDRAGGETIPKLDEKGYQIAYFD